MINQSRRFCFLSTSAEILQITGFTHHSLQHFPTIFVYRYFYIRLRGGKDKAAFRMTVTICPPI